MNQFQFKCEEKQVILEKVDLEKEMSALQEKLQVSNKSLKHQRETNATREVKLKRILSQITKAMDLIQNDKLLKTHIRVSSKLFT